MQFIGWLDSFVLAVNDLSWGSASYIRLCQEKNTIIRNIIIIMIIFIIA